MNNLVWKQWRESKRHLAILSILTLLIVCYTISYEVIHSLHAIVGSFSGQLLLYTTGASIFLAMQTVQGEQTSKTLAFTASLPISQRKIAAARVLGAIITLVIPILTAAVLLSFALALGVVQQAEPRSALAYVSLEDRAIGSLSTSLYQLWSVTAIATMVGMHGLLFLCLMGNFLRSQAQIGFVGAVFALGCLLMSRLFWGRNDAAQVLFGAALPQSLVTHWGYDAYKPDQVGHYNAPTYVDHEFAPCYWYSLVLSLPLLVAIGRMVVVSYGRWQGPKAAVNQKGFRLALPSLGSFLPFRWPNKLVALLWLELRQSVPIACCGLFIVLLLAISEVIFGSSQGTNIFTSVSSKLPNNIFGIGWLWAVVVGSSLFSEELETKIGSFWRSRPISLALWFWTKFLVGLVVVFVFLDGVTILASWNTPARIPKPGYGGASMGWSYVACQPVFHAFLYSLAVLGTCLIRRPVIGGIVAIFGFAILMIAVSFFESTMHLDPMNVYNALNHEEKEGKLDFTKHFYLPVYGTLAAGVFVAGLVASFFARPFMPIRRWPSTGYIRFRGPVNSLS